VQRIVDTNATVARSGASAAVIRSVPQLAQRVRRRDVTVSNATTLLPSEITTNRPSAVT
jgi:hypothetical protein